MADADIIVVGAGLAGLVAAAEAADAGRSVIVLDQEGAASLGGQAWWSLGGLFLVDSPEQRHRPAPRSLPELESRGGGELTVGFESGSLRPPQIQTLPLDNAVQGYETVEKGSQSRIVLLPG